MRPHVLYVTPIFGYPALGGPRLRTYNTLRALARVADVSLYVTEQPDTRDRAAALAHMLTLCRAVEWPEPRPEPDRSLPRHLARRLLPAGARAALGRWRSASGEPGSRPGRLEELWSWIERRQPDLIWLGFGGISYDLTPLRARTGKPLVLETESVWSRFILRELPFVDDARKRAAIAREGAAKEAEERAGAQAVDIITAASEVDAEYFRALAPSPERVMLLSNVIDVDAYAAPTTPLLLARPALVFAGSLSRGTANVDASAWLVREIMPRVWRARPDAHVYLVGRDPAPEVAALRGSRVHVTGEVASIVPYLRGAAAALVPLRWESGTRFKILEAFACRTPVVSTTLGAEGLRVQHDHHLLLADQPETFAGAVLALLDQPRLGQRLADSAYQLVRGEYDLSTAEQQIAAVLQRLGLGVTALASR
ncbi:MAG: glycosyltransferase family 4 protein [Chloroflexota bacterium]|nr:glycosyltransferase family 4 protein [Chloroflexota bacterium]